MKNFYFAVFAFAVLFTACQSEVPDGEEIIDNTSDQIVDENKPDTTGNNFAEPYLSLELTPQQKLANEESNRFALFLLRKMAETTDENFIISPLSTQCEMATAMLMAKGDGKSEIQKALGYQNISIDDFNDYYNTVISYFKNFYAEYGLKDTIFKNNVITKNDLGNYLTNEITRYFGTQIELVTDDLHSPLSIENTTQIELYKTGYTVMHNFNNLNGTQIEKHFDLLYNKPVSTCKRPDGSVHLSFWQNYLFAFDIIMPGENQSIGELLKTVDDDFLQGKKDEMTLQTICMPIFGPKYSIDLTECCRAMGIKSIFGKESSEIEDTATGIEYLQSIRQNTELSIWSTLEGFIPSGNVFDGVDTLVDRPYILFIREKASGAILFIAQINNI